MNGFGKSGRAGFTAAIVGWGGAALGASLLLSGCGGDARVELSAADALTAVAGQMQGTIEEYHVEVTRSDDARESAAIAAFVERVKKDAGNDAALAAHASDFEAALVKVRGDREVEWSRRNAAVENVVVLRDVSRGLQKLAIQSLALDDELKRYLTGWISARQATSAASRRSVAEAVGGAK